MLSGSYLADTCSTYPVWEAGWNMTLAARHADTFCSLRLVHDVRYEIWVCWECWVWVYYVGKCLIVWTWLLSEFLSKYLKQIPKIFPIRERSRKRKHPQQGATWPGSSEVRDGPAGCPTSASMSSDPLNTSTWTPEWWVTPDRCWVVLNNNPITYIIVYLWILFFWKILRCSIKLSVVCAQKLINDLTCAEVIFKMIHDLNQVHVLDVVKKVIPSHCI